MIIDFRLPWPSPTAGRSNHCISYWHLGNEHGLGPSLRAYPACQCQQHGTCPHLHLSIACPALLHSTVRAACKFSLSLLPSAPYQLRTIWRFSLLNDQAEAACWRSGSADQVFAHQEGRADCCEAAAGAGLCPDLRLLLELVRVVGPSHVQPQSIMTHCGHACGKLHVTCLSCGQLPLAEMGLLHVTARQLPSMNENRCSLAMTA